MTTKGDEWLEVAVYDTIRYFDLFKMPLTAVQIWRSLVAEREVRGVRWHGHSVPGLEHIKFILTESRWLNQRISSVWGYYYMTSTVSKMALKQKKDIDMLGEQFVRQRLIRHSLAQQKWKITRRVVWWLAWLPFVRMIGGSGSLAMFNTEYESDLDLFVVVRRGRIWTARLFLLIVSQLSGRRRKYWDEVAPDKVCLNHYVADDSLLMSSEVRNLYTAQLYMRLVPLTGLDMHAKWAEMNRVWIRRWMMFPDVPVLMSRLYLQVGSGLRVGQKLLEGFLMELPGDVLERVAAKMQVWVIGKHARWRREVSGLVNYDRIVVSAKELAFHPNTRVPEILQQFEEEEGQGRLL